MGLQTEVSELSKTVARCDDATKFIITAETNNAQSHFSLSGSEEKSALRGDDIETQVKELKDRLDKYDSIDKNINENDLPTE